MLFNLAKSYVESINKGAVPSIESSWSYICRNECQNAMQKAFQVFEHRLYEEFNNRVPMPQEELRGIYKMAKEEAMNLFRATAVGEVRDEFLTILKKQMNDKYDTYYLENEKTSEQECHQFLQRNYNMIAQKLTNDEYDNIDSLNQEIHGFLDYFYEEGPKGPNSMNIAQMFCYDKMLEGSHFFLENAKRHGHMQTQLAEQTLAKLKEDLTE